MSPRVVLPPRAIVLTFLTCTLAALCHASSPLSITSPDGYISIGFRLDHAGTPQWRASGPGGDILGWSSLGLTFLRGSPLTSHFTMVDSSIIERDGTYELVIGKTKNARDHYRELRVRLQESIMPHRLLQLTFRAYDDGVAFRYTLPDQDPIKEFDIVQENTQFSFAGDMKAWAFQINTFISSYEGLYLPTTLDAIPDTGLVYLPLTMQRPDGVTLCLTEADLTDYAGMYLRGLPGTALQVALAPLPGRSPICVHGKTPFDSPWRVIMIGKKPGDLIESTIILNLNPPCALDDVSWIEPGKAIFPWWPNFYCDRPGVASTLDFENQKYYVDFASENNVPYLELEPPWYGDQDECILHPEKFDITKPVPSLQLPLLFNYAASKHVRLFLWTHWKNVDRQADAAFPLYVKWGAAGVKIDFMNRDDQEMVRWYHMILRKAAAYHLMVFFHGAYKPTGLQRTYPHLVTQEGVLGNEQNKVTYLCSMEHTVTLPFTRMLVGPMDFTPGGFRNVTAAQFTPNMDRPMVLGTRCHQLAMFVVYESPLMMVCDDPSAYRNQPGIEFIREVPTSWDHTRVIEGSIAEHIIIARKKGNDWYLGAMTDWTARNANIPLSFLDQGNYHAEIFQDGEDADSHPTGLKTINRIVTAKDTLSARLAKGGGLVARLWRE
jgi:alpha-glucosidase